MRVALVLLLLPLAGCVGFEEADKILEVEAPAIWPAGTSWSYEVHTVGAYTGFDEEDSESYSFDETSQESYKVLNTTLLAGRPILSLEMLDNADDEYPWEMLVSASPGGGGMHRVYFDPWEQSWVEDGDFIEPVPGLEFPLRTGGTWSGNMSLGWLEFDVAFEVLGAETRDGLGGTLDGVLVRAIMEGGMTEEAREANMGSSWRTIEHIDEQATWTVDMLYDAERNLLSWIQITGGGRYEEVGAWSDGETYNETYDYSIEQTQTLTNFTTGDGREEALTEDSLDTIFEPCCPSHAFGRIDRDGPWRLNAAEPTPITYSLETYGSTLEANWTIDWTLLDHEGNALKAAQGDTFTHTFDEIGVYGVGVRVHDNGTTKISDLSYEEVDYEVATTVSCGEATLAVLEQGGCDGISFPVATQTNYIQVYAVAFSPLEETLTGSLRIVDGAGKERNTYSVDQTAWVGEYAPYGSEPGAGTWNAQVELDTGVMASVTYDVRVSSGLAEWPEAWEAYY